MSSFRRSTRLKATANHMNLHAMTDENLGEKHGAIKEYNDNCIDAVRNSYDNQLLPHTPSKKKENKRKIDIIQLDGTQLKECGNISPSKIKRCDQLIQKHLVSPTRLMDRLNIMHDEINREEIKPATTTLKPNQIKYKNARLTLNSVETRNLPGREQQLQELQNFLEEHLHEENSGSLYVSGQPGTGKTACLSLLLQTPKFANHFKCAYVNCTSIASVNSIYKKLCIELAIKPKGRTEHDYIETLKNHFISTKKMILIVLDEIDQLCSSRQSVLYTIFELPALPGAKLLLIGIANSLDLTNRVLVRLNSRVELKPRLMHFPPYTKQQIVEIFKSRLELANVIDIFPNVTIQFLAAKVSAVSGDVRRALDIGRRVIELAENQKKGGQRVFDVKKLEIDNENGTDILKPVQVTQVVEVLTKVYGTSQNLQEEIEESFPLQQKLMLCTLMLMLRNEKNKDIVIGRLQDVYRRVCNKHNISALDQAEFFGLIDLVETRGILRLIRKKELRLSKVQLLWDEDEVNAALSDKQLIATILQDTSCLRYKK